MKSTNAAIYPFFNCPKFNRLITISPLFDPRDLGKSGVWVEIKNSETRSAKTKNLKRRTFIKSLAATTPTGASLPYAKSSAFAARDYFGHHLFIEQNPEAFFIMRTSVDNKTNNPAKINTGAYRVL